MFLLPKCIQTHLLGVSRAQFKQGEFVSTGWHAELRSFYFHVRQERHYDLVGQFSELTLYLCDKHGQHLLLLLLDPELEAEI